MNIKTIKLAISGAYGRMGKNIIKEIQEYKNIILNYAIVKKNNQTIILKNQKKINIIENISEITNYQNSFDILIDFSNPQTTLNNLKFCNKYKKKIVIGTTGFNEIEKNIIKNYAKNIGIVFSSNFSIGINLIFRLLKNITNILDSSYDIEIIEAHHKNKIDSPSGTALTMGEIIARNKGWNLKKCSIYRKKENQQPKKTNEIGFSIIRSGNIIGEHTVMFSNMGEKIEIKHSANNRNAFSKGAIQAAIWLLDKKPGLYNMLHVLNKQK
ncbi:4-hydroxy-tetrahydrodipicolinate reductase [Buchnera aphidicola]|uniref:4-hydroxy-tetrahydrodipicolinate reductase n=1 Tax=Buchnera aphidicola TaxID=9 RepID=UPI003464CA1A